jgi:hypothetical protein
MFIPGSLDRGSAMLRPILLILSAFFFGTIGCLPRESNTTLVPSNPFGGPPPPQTARRSPQPASIQAAARVDSLGRKIVAANPQLGMPPLFRTIGVPQPETFHQGTSEVDITEGLVNQCSTEGQLAAVLASELGKMISEREFLAGPQARAPEREPPMEVRVGSDNAGSFGPADQLHRAELAKYDKERRQRAANAAAPPEPQALARDYLIRAGFTAADLDAAAPLLRSAAENNTLAKQLLSPPQVQR